MPCPDGVVRRFDGSAASCGWVPLVNEAGVEYGKERCPHYTRCEADSWFPAAHLCRDVTEEANKA
jgi:hypothetical protein